MPDPALLHHDLQRRVDDVEPLRRRARNTAWIRVVGLLILGLICLAFVAGGTLGTVWVTGTFITRRTAALIAAVLAGAAATLFVSARILMAFSRWRQGDDAAYAEQFRQRVIAPTLREVLPACPVSLEGQIDPATFAASALFRSGAELFRSTAGFSGNAAGVPFRGSVLQVHRKAYSSERRTDVKIPFLTGIFVHLDRPAPFPSTLRLVDAAVYEGWEGTRWGVERRENTVKTRSGIPAFDEVATVVIDQDQNAAPPLPEQLYRAFLEIRTLVERPVFVSLNSTGAYLAVAVEANRLPLEERLVTANRPQELAAEFDLLRRTVRAAGILREALP